MTGTRSCATQCGDEVHSENAVAARKSVFIITTIIRRTEAPGKPPEQRIAESEAAAKQMRLEWRGNLRFPDARLENSLPARMTLAVKIRELKPRVVILPYWEGRHPDHYRACEMGYEACFLAGLKKLDEYAEPHRPFKILYSGLYTNIKPSFVVDISEPFIVKEAMEISGIVALPVRSI